MGLTYSEAKRCGLEYLWPTESKPLPDVPPPPSMAPKDGMNKLERAFWERLRDAYGYRASREPITLKLAGRTRYTPDFMSYMGLKKGEYACTFWEVKGFMRDDAAVKLKVAASMYLVFDFVLVTRVKRKWECRDVSHAGISREVWTPDWLK